MKCPNADLKNSPLRILKKIYLPLALLILLAVAQFNAGCGIYSFRDVSIPDSIKSFRMQFIENRASYVNPQLSPSLTEGIRRKILSQTRLAQTSNEDAHLDISGEIRDYIVTTSGISNKQEVTNRLTVSVHITVRKSFSTEPPEEFDISRGFEFSARLSQQTAEGQLLEEMIRSLSDDVFNRLFSNW
jgi:outer membrane lipopolysaccharide assembly protein LptE/RlpB